MRKIISVILILALTLSTSMVFAQSDVNDMMSLLSELKIMQGDPDGNFRLNDGVSRAEFSKITIATSQFRDSVATGSSVSPFRDVLASHWAAPYIQLAVINGFAKGYTDATFRPDGDVLYEEAITMLLKVLGYTDEEFGSSWPYGQVGTAKRIGLCDGIDREIGDSLNRGDVMRMTYNLLNTEAKGTGQDYINTLNYRIIEDVILVATTDEDSSVGSDKVFTTAGTFKTDQKFNKEYIGRKGDIVIKNTDEVAAFIPNNQIVNTYNIYQTLGNEIVVMENGNIRSLNLDNNLSVFNKSAKTTLSAMLPTIFAGDVLITYANEQNVIDYGILKTDQLQGPFTYLGGSIINGFDISNAVISRNGQPVSAEQLQANDIVYYSQPLNTVWSYSTKVTGVYEKAEPNKDTPTSVQISGVSYTLESAAAFNKLSSKGTLSYGDTITIMLGRSNQIADVLSSPSESNLIGYLVETGTKEFIEADQKKYVNQYIKFALPDGNVYEYKTDRDYGNYINRAVGVSFVDGMAKISLISGQNSLSGKFDWKNRTFGGRQLSADLKILDVLPKDMHSVGAYTTVFPQRIDGLNIGQNSVLSFQTNKAGEIIDIILNDYTGDVYQYGIMKKAENTSSRMATFGSYEYIIDGSVKNAAVSGKIFTVQSGQPAKFITTPMGLDSVVALARIDGKVEPIDDSNIKINGVSYPLSHNAVVYKTDLSYNYSVIPLSDAISQGLNLTAYYDKQPKDGGQIRILIAR